MKVEHDNGYIEGTYIAPLIIKGIKQTTWGCIENAIESKQTLIDNFESKFGYSREMNVESFDRNYSYNLGILDRLMEFKEKI